MTSIISGATGNASRPHLLTLVASFGSLCVSICGFYLSYQAFSISSMALNIGQRAYVVSALKVEPEKDGFRFVLSAKNLGNTPAYMLNAKLTYTDSRNGDHFIESPLTVVGPKDEVSVIPTDVEHFHNREWVLYGEINYEDVFHKHHFTTFCYLYDKVVVNNACVGHTSRTD